MNNWLVPVWFHFITPKTEPVVLGWESILMCLPTLVCVWPCVVLLKVFIQVKHLLGTFLIYDLNYHSSQSCTFGTSEAQCRNEEMVLQSWRDLPKASYLVDYRASIWTQFSEPIAFSVKNTLRLNLKVHSCSKTGFLIQ